MACEMKNYNSCPLKKRPFVFVDEVGSEPEQQEPVNLCIRKDENTYVSKIRSTPLKDITTNNQQDRVRFAPYRIAESRVPIVKQDLYNLLPGYAANTLSYTQQSSSPSSASSVQSEPEYWQSYSREASMSPQPRKIARYEPYVSQQRFIQEYSSMSPTYSHSSMNSFESSRSSMSPASPSFYETTTRHSAVIKSDVPRYQCAACSKSYSTYSGLTKHKEFHCTALPNNQAKKSFDCQFCPKSYTSLGALKMHIRTHTKPCKCHLCGKSFSRPWLLQGHIHTHTGDKPFSCTHCPRAFADKSNLRAHLQTHTDVKKYSCTTCSKTFSRMSLLTKHCESGCPGLVQHHH